ncbi:hypothetical protein FHW37_101982 [Neorhizobium alkalisoli]|uniref:Uncharacterized protein n=1 Tax=Neorhizobium alkalisoli TaxID=528178 RepID=A0A561R990_9HYPH|nr:hypothetical protein FHW37_101982 [Neorhizobium alkalisoli]
MSSFPPAISIAFCEAALAPLGIIHAHDHDGKDRPSAKLGADFRVFGLDDAALIDIGLAGEFHPGLQPPATLFGSGFAQTVAATSIIDV